MGVTQIELYLALWCFGLIAVNDGSTPNRDLTIQIFWGFGFRGFHLFWAYFCAFLGFYDWNGFIWEGWTWKCPNYAHYPKHKIPPYPSQNPPVVVVKPSSQHSIYYICKQIWKCPNYAHHPKHKIPPYPSQNPPGVVVKPSSQHSIYYICKQILFSYPFPVWTSYVLWSPPHAYVQLRFYIRLKFTRFN